jgi:lysophospholipase L1-like esterase
MAGTAPPPVPQDDNVPSRPQRATAATIAGFIAVVVALSAFPRVPDDLRPLRLDSSKARQTLLTKVFAKPKMTLAEHERAMEGEDKIVAEDDSTEDKELHDESRAAADLAALPAAQPAAESEGEGDVGVVGVDRAAVLGRMVSADSARLREQQRTLGMPGTELRNPCLERTGSDDSACVRTALDPFFSTLDAIARGDNDAFARVVVLGNSLIASDHVTDIVRDRLVDSFGSAGRGFLLTERLAKGVGRRVRTGQGSDGWITRSFAQDPPWAPGVRFGFSGALHEASTNGEWTRWRADGAQTARLFWLDTGAGIVVDVDGKPWLKIPAGTGTGVGKSAEIRLPPLSQSVRLVADKGARIFGIALDSGGRGVSLDTIGVPAASSRLFTDLVDEQIFRDQLTARDPALTVIMLGGNETRGLSFGTIDEPTITARLTTLIERVRQAAPTSACLLVTPIDAGKVTTGDDTLVTRPEIHKVIAIQQQVAVDMGCGFFDLFAAMGGAGSLQKMRDAKLISDDLVHPNAKGGDVLGQLLADGLLSSWRDTPAASAQLAHRRVQQEAGRPRFAGLSFPAEQQAKPVTLGEDVIDDDNTRPPPLSRFFARLASLEQGSTRRVAIGQFGASHTAGQSLTDRMRNRLGQRFGLAGRGFVAVGKPSKRLQPSGVVRDIVGGFELADGREVVSGGALGMSGTKTRLMPGAKAVVGFCQNCGPTAGDDQGTVQLAWLYTPDMGSADVFVDGERRATLSPNSRRRDSDMQFLSLPVAHERALVEVVARSEAEPSSQSPDGLSPVGPVHVLSVVEEMHRPGVVLDSIGLPGTTGMTPQRWRQDLYGEEVRSRRYDLIITAWGTNEAGIGSLDAATYKHHFGNTLSTLQAAAPEADCLIIGASDRLDNKNGILIPAAAHELVERVQQELAVEHGCAFFSMRQAMGGPLSMKRWVKEGLGLDDHVHFTQEGYDRLGDMIIDDLLAAWRWRQEQATAVAKTAAATTTPPAPATTPAEAAHAVP